MENNGTTHAKPRLQFGGILRAYRQKAGLEQEEVGRTLGVSKHTVSNWERDVARPDVSYIPTLARVLSMPLHAFFGMPEPERLSKAEQELLADFRLLTPAYRSHAKAQVAACVLLQTEARAASLRSTFRALTGHEGTLAAGFDVPLESEPNTYRAYVRRGGLADRADDIFPVNGQSMEPMFPDGSKVYVARAEAGAVAYGEVIACVVAGTPLVKRYERDGLHSVNPLFPVIRVSEHDDMRLIGRVLGPVGEHDLATEEEVRELEALAAE
ncbi:MAG: helix-turn-helix domain-containing protein [Clostridia bacterium]|nr:helix-turn-helix domain-containing protein [Clostridia bacterium]